MKLVLVLVLAVFVGFAGKVEASGLQSGEPERVRSSGRTWTGVALLGVGSALSLNEMASVCSETAVGAAFADVPTCSSRAVRLGAWAAVATTGALLATVWSDVPVVRAVNLKVGPRGFRASRTFGW